MSRTRDLSKVLSSNTNLVTTAELNSAIGAIDLSAYLTQSSASSTYATQASLSTIDSDNNPDIYLNMGG
jgi:hypothetical protein